MSEIDPVVTVAVPSLNQGEYLDTALQSLFDQDLPLEVYVADGGSSDNTIEVLRKWEHRLKYWRSRQDQGQAMAINECIARGSAPFVCWLNSDDRLLPDGLFCLVQAMRTCPEVPAAYGKVWNDRGGRLRPVLVEPFHERRLAVHCIISQPGTLVRRSAWEGVGGLREELYMALDYDLWWRLYQKYGPLKYVDRFVAINRDHPRSKTNTNRRLHYREAMAIVRLYYGRLPIKWWIAQPYAVWLRGARSLWTNRVKRKPQ